MLKAERFLSTIYLFIFLNIISICSAFRPGSKTVSNPQTIVIADTHVDSAEGMILGVIGFEGSSLSQRMLCNISERRGYCFIKFGAFSLFNQRTMKERFAEQEFQRMGYASNGLAVEAGMFKGAALMLTGSINKLGSLWSVDNRIIDETTENFVLSVLHEFRDGVKRIREKALQAEVRALKSARALDNDEAKPAPSPAHSIVNVQQDVLKVAVVAFQENGDLNIPDAGAIVTGWMSASLFQTGVFDLYERVLLPKVLEEQELELSGILNEKTTTEIGKLYGVEAIVTGSISKFGNTLSIVAKLIDTKTAKLIAIADVKTKDIDAIPGAVDELAWKLANAPEP
ncbi:MAG: hypothetical protein IIA59_00070 [Candidatus Marinimicrobia bacterium]|nr:hypothetical protein [Candidatus Neomarinimicrobiota bacterium]